MGAGNNSDEAIDAIRKCLSWKPSKVVHKEATELLQKIKVEKEREGEEWIDW